MEYGYLGLTNLISFRLCIMYILVLDRRKGLLNGCMHREVQVSYYGKGIGIKLFSHVCVYVRVVGRGVTCCTEFISLVMGMEVIG